jgi:diguanylate cyclase (GGDEF)-like protein
VSSASLALAAAVVALLVVAIVGLAGRRGRARSDARMSEALQAVGARLDALSDQVADALEEARDEGLRTRALGDLVGSLDLDETLARTVELAAGIRGVDAALVRVAALDGNQHVASRGIPADEAARQVVSGPPDGRVVDAVAISYVYPNAGEPPGALRSGLAVRLEVEGETIGFLAAYSYDPPPRLGPEVVSRLLAIAAAAAPAVDTARRFREARAAADEDAVTGLPGRSSFHDALTREVARAHRYERRLALLVVDVDDFHLVNDRVGQLGGDGVLADVAAVVRAAVRRADSAFRIGGDEFAVLLPEAERHDGEGLFARVLAGVAERRPGTSLSGGVASLSAEDDALTLLDRAEGALRSAKSAGKGTSA